MVFFRPLSEKISYDDYIEAILAGNDAPQYLGLSALKNSDVLAAVSIIAGDIARFPIIKKDYDDKFVEDSELNYLLNVRATGNASAYQWKFAMAVNTILTGNAYSMIIRDPLTAKPLELRFFRPSETTVTEDDNHQLIYTFIDNLTGKTYNRRADDVVHWKFFTHDSITGRSPLLSLGDEIGLQGDGMKTLRRFFRDGFAGGIIKMKGSQLNGNARKRVREEFEEMRKGASGGSPLVFDDSQDYEPLEIDTNVLQLINSNDFSTSQIAKCLRVPAYKLAVNSPNQSVKQLNEDYVVNDLPYYFNAIAAEFQLKLLAQDERREYKLEFDTRSITTGDVEEIIKMKVGGVITGNEARQRKGLTKSDDPNMDRFESRLDSIFLDKKEEYQSNNKQQPKKMKGGDNDAEN